MIHSELGVLLKLMQNLDYYLGYLLPCLTLAIFVIVCIIIVRKLWVWRGNKQPLHEKKNDHKQHSTPKVPIQV